MKRTTFRKSLFLCFGILFSAYLNAQLHSAPACGENFTLDWSTAPSTSNEYNWLPAGSLTNAYTDVDGSGIDINVTFTGDTGSLGFWSTAQTPKVGNSSSTLYEGLDLLTNGFVPSGITCTITFSSPIYALSFDMHHVNTTGVSGDKYTISATTTTGGTILPTFTSSATPSYVTNSGTGVIDATGPSVSGNDAVVGVNFLDDDYITSVTFVWQDCSTCTPGNIHGSGLGNFSFCIPQTLDFDGVNDYISRTAFLGQKSEVTMMSWIKLDNSFNGGEIMGQRNFRMYLDANKRLKAFVKTNTGTVTSITTPNSNAPILQTNLWYHVATSYEGSTGTIKLFLNGENIWEFNGLSGTVLNNATSWNADHDFEIGRNTAQDNNYFEGSIYESRVYTKALTDNQLHRQINQEIENNSGNIRGTVIPKDIEGLKWNDLVLYYKMEIINTGYTPDESSTGTNGRLHNMRTYQERTAPLPYKTKSGGDGLWTSKNNWLYGDVWDITTNHPDCAIVHITENLETDEDHNTIGLIIDNNVKLEVKDDVGLFNSWYVKLDGDIDLVGESQFIQTDDSDLDVASAGTIERDQQGTADLYTYNYWSSPVGVSKTTTNNNSYTLPQVLKDGTQDINFLTSGYDGANTSPISIADYWIWKFANQPDDDYSAWQHVRSTGTLLAGEGFTMKGPGSGSISDEQNYVFKGKPNNGDINLSITAGNDYLVGNPYPSAMDAQQFILDNAPTIEGAGNTTGTIYFWEHWGGGSHNLAEYQGGYATYNLSGGVPAAALGSADPDVDQSAIIGTKLPGRYIPVSQGFFVIGEATGTIKFNNGQRVYQKESASSVFMEANNPDEVVGKGKSSETDNNDDQRMKIRLGFDSVNTLHRQLLVTVDGNATPDKDWGYDAVVYDQQMDDMYWLIEDEKYVIQGTNSITEQTVLPIGIHTNQDGENSISIEALENVSEDLPVYLHDKDLSIYHNLKEGAYSVELAAGEYLNRFEITFSTEDTLGTSENDLSVLQINYNNSINSIVIQNPENREIKNLELFNILGQSVFFTDALDSIDEHEVKISNLSTGTYLINIETPKGKISKKVLVM